MGTSSSAVVADQLTKTFADDIRAVDGVSFAVEAGEAIRG